MDVEIDNVFHIPAYSAVQNAQPAVQTVELTASAPVKITDQTKPIKTTASYKEIYAELNAASEEVIECRNKILKSIC